MSAPLHSCPCGNTVRIDGILPTGFPFGPPEVYLAYHWGCAERLGVPRPPTELDKARAEISRLKLQAEIDQRKIREWRLAAELGEDLVTADTPQRRIDLHAKRKEAMRRARGEA